MNCDRESFFFVWDFLICFSLNLWFFVSNFFESRFREYLWRRYLYFFWVIWVLFILRVCVVVCLVLLLIRVFEKVIKFFLIFGIFVVWKFINLLRVFGLLSLSLRIVILFCIVKSFFWRFWFFFCSLCFGGIR